jgi:glycosyltransferase involved in cell wall biosynthesis
MKIAIIGPAHPLRGGGLATFNERLAQVLQEQGHNVTIYSFSLQYPSFLFPGSSQFTDEPAPQGLKIKTIINSINPLNWVSSGLKIKRDAPDLVIVRYWLPFMGPALGTILRIVRSKKAHVLCIADNVIPHELRPGDNLFTKYFIGSVDTFVTMSKDVLKDLATFTSKPAQFTPHPLYDNYLPAISKTEACRQLGIDPDRRYLLFFGFIRKYKGLDLLLQAMADERIRNANIKLIIAGEFYDKRDMYDDLIKGLQLEDSILPFTDFIPNNEVHKYFSAADVVVQPYKNATQSGITLAAYYFEKPMIVTNVGGLHEVVPDGVTGFIVEPDAKSIADAIIRFYQPGSLPGIEQNLKAEKQKYSWDNFIRTIMNISGLADKK